MFINVKIYNDDGKGIDGMSIPNQKSKLYLIFRRGKGKILKAG